MINTETLINDIFEIEDGNKSAIDVFKAVYTEVKDINALFDKIKQLALKESSNLSKQELEQIGIERRNGGVSGYDYSVNSEWVEINDRRKTLEKHMQQAYKSGNRILIEETGELIDPAQPKGYKKDSIMLKK